MEIFKMRPAYRWGEMTPWGGNRLAEWLGKDTPGDRVGESLEVSDLKGLESVILNGAYEGQPLSKALEDDYVGVTGTDKRPFPLLLKLLDAKDILSVQVHPGDEYALKTDGKLGKTEAWMVISADEGSRIAYGLKPLDKPLEEVVAEGKIEECLNWVYPRAGDVYYIPHGCVHALGGGVMVYEIQQSSDATYRFWDWGRVGKDGKPRELHTKKALDVSRTDIKLGKLEGATVLREGGSVTYFISDENFCLARLNVCGKMPVNNKYMCFVTPLEPCVMGWDDGEVEIGAFETALVPAACPHPYIKGKLAALMSTLPDNESLKRELDYRAELVAGLDDTDK